MAICGDCEKKEINWIWNNKDFRAHLKEIGWVARKNQWHCGCTPNTVCTGQVAGVSATPVLSTPEPSPVKAAGSEPATTSR